MDDYDYPENEREKPKSAEAIQTQNLLNQSISQYM